MGVHLTSQAQKFGVPVIWIDVEGTTTEDNMTQLGADPSNIFLVTPEEGEFLTIEGVTERVLDIIEVYKKVDIPVLIIWDTLAATTPEVMLQDNYNPNRIGSVASAVTFMTQKLGQSINQTNVGFVILNQARADMNAPGMVPRVKSTGGFAMEHWASLRLEVKRGRQIKGKVKNLVTGATEDLAVAYVFRVIMQKSKVSPPGRRAEGYLVVDPYIGLDIKGNLYYSAFEQYKQIKSAGGWRKYQPSDGSPEVSQRDGDWIGFLKSEEGEYVAQDLFNRQMLENFPNGFAPFNNENVDITLDPLYANLEKYYQKQGVEVRKLPDNLHQHTVAELRDIATQHGMSIKATKKDDIIEEMLTQEAEGTQDTEDNIGEVEE